MRTLFFLLLPAILFSNCENKKVSKIDLTGEWTFQIDSLDQGIGEHWYQSELADLIQLPGSMTTNGKGNEISINTRWTGGIVDSSWYHDEKYAKYREPGNVKVPFWLQPEKHYVGAAWYQKVVEIPANWEEQHIELFMERCHWEMRVWVDDQEVGMQNSLATPHIYNLTDYLAPGKHTISILVDNRVKEIDPGINSHSIADHTQSNWNGIVGKIELKTRPKIHLAKVRIDTDVPNKTVLVSGEILNLKNEIAAQKATLKTEIGNVHAGVLVRMESEISMDEEHTNFAVRIPLGDTALLWDEFDPSIYTASLVLESTAGTDFQEVNFGIREFGIQNTQFTLNGRPIFLRGTLECAIFPKTGYPPTDVDEWKRIFNVVKSHGLNHVRFHSWCPPEAAFNAADELGVYLQVECSSWANQSTTLGDGLPIDKFVYDESERIVNAYGNHPSFVMMAYGNEPRGRNHTNYLADFLDYWKSKDDRRIYTSAAGWPVLSENEYHNIPQPRIQAWGAGLNSMINSQPPTTNFDWTSQIEDYDIPVVSHEIGQWCVYPNFKEIEKYDGVLKAKNFEIFQETLIEQGLGNLADSFLLASGKLQALCYKADIEAALRTPGFGGFQLLDLHDFPGQGTALVGVLDPFWGEKGYVSPEEYSRFCNSTVPLARMDQRVFSNAENFVAQIEVSHFGAEPLTKANAEWQIKDQEHKILFKGTLTVDNISIGNGIALGEIEQELSSIAKPTQLTLSVKIQQFENDWDFWVYPKSNETSNDVLVTKALDEKAIRTLQQGGKVLWSIPEDSESKNLNDGIGFSSIFWNTAWTGGQLPNSLGILCNPKHPALAEFPTEYHSNWQWWDAMSYSNGIFLNDFPVEVQPIVRVIDDWFGNRPEALLIEVKVGEGKLLISGIDFFNNMNHRPAGKQLLHSLTKYMESDSFAPKPELSVSEVKVFFSE
jgi:hypothetical protein